jgi:hypothetical protein
MLVCQVTAVLLKSKRAPGSLKRVAGSLCHCSYWCAQKLTLEKPQSRGENRVQNKTALKTGLA